MKVGEIEYGGIYKLEDRWELKGTVFGKHHGKTKTRYAMPDGADKLPKEFLDRDSLPWKELIHTSYDYSAPHEDMHFHWACAEADVPSNLVADICKSMTERPADSDGMKAGLRGMHLYVFEGLFKVPYERDGDKFTLWHNAFNGKSFLVKEEE